MDKSETSTPRFETKNGRPVVVLEESEYERLKLKADEWEPPLPAVDEDGCYPAVEYAIASLARKVIRHRRKLGLTQQELARRAGIRLATLIRAERGKEPPSIRTIDKIDAALSKVEAERRRKRRSKSS